MCPNTCSCHTFKDIDIDILYDKLESIPAQHRKFVHR